MPKFILGGLIASLIIGNTYAVTAASEVAKINTSQTANPNTLELDDSGYSSYISGTNYPKLNLNDSFGQLIDSNKIAEYNEPQLYNYYKRRICNGVYWFNCRFNISNLKKNTGINISDIYSLISQRFETVSGYQVNYTTISVNGGSHPVTGAILVPNSSIPLKGVVIYYHGSSLVKSNVPSNFVGDENEVSRLAASTLATDGYVVLMPDYIGLGGDKISVFPSLVYPTANALSGVYMLKLLPQVVPALRFKLQNRHVRLMIAGYADGAEYALWSAKILQDNKWFLERYGFSAQKVVAMSGPYNMSRIMLPYLYGNVDEVKSSPYYVANLRTSALAKPAILDSINKAYSQYGSNTNESKDYSRIANSISPMANYALSDDKQFLETLQKADIYNWQATIPVSFISLEYDSVIPRINSEVAYLAMTKQKSSQLEITQIPNQDFKSDGHSIFADEAIDHASAENFMILFARKEFDANLANTNSN